MTLKYLNSKKEIIIPHSLMMRDFKDKFIGSILAAKQRNVPKNQLQKNLIKFKKKYIKMTWTDK